MAGWWTKGGGTEAPKRQAPPTIPLALFPAPSPLPYSVVCLAASCLLRTGSMLCRRILSENTSGASRPNSRSESGIRPVCRPRNWFMRNAMFLYPKISLILSPESGRHPHSGLDSRLRIGTHFRFRNDSIPHGLNSKHRHNQKYHLVMKKPVHLLTLDIGA